MANRFMDSFDHYATADITKKYSSYTDNSTTTATTDIRSGGRTNNALYIDAYGKASYVSLILDEQATWYVGFAFMMTGSPNNGIVIAFCSGPSQAMQCGLMLTSSSQLVFCDNNKNQLGTVNAGVLSQNVWYYIETKMMFKSSISAGDCVIRVNEVVAATLDAGTQTNWGLSSSTTASGIYLGSFFFGLTSASITAYYDDFYVNDATGTHNNSYLGDITVDALFTSAAGTYQDFTVTGTTTSVLATTDRAPDGDSTYVQSSTTNARESFTYTLPNYSITTVYAVQLLGCTEKSSSGSRSAVPFVRSSITNYEQSSIAIGTGYLYTRSVIELNPATGVAWTESDVRSIEAGVRIG